MQSRRNISLFTDKQGPDQTDIDSREELQKTKISAYE